jgi:1-aminocyclopropane-1-carboxylate deaminase
LYYGQTNHLFPVDFADKRRKKKYKMININSPVEQLHLDLFEQKKIQVFLKRDDLIHPFISGNKWRKLKFTLQDAVQKNKTHLVSFGGAYSNHLNALACAAATFGFKATAFVRGETVSNHMLALNKLWGMELIFVDRTAYKNKKELFEKHFLNDDKANFIDEGGAGTFGAKGCEEIVTELTQIYDKIFCAVGTATTLQGIAQAIKNNGLTTKAEGICVLKGAEEIDAHLKENELENYYKIHHQFHEGGYAKTNPELFDFIKLFASKTGILLDQVYTAKMMKAVFTLAEQDYFEPNSKILCVHTGGLLGLLGVLK